MFAFILACILVLAGIVLMLVGRFKVEEGTRNEKTIDLRPFGVLAFALGGLVMVMASVYTQDPGEAVIVKSFTGKVQGGPDTTSGMGITAPWNKVIKFDIRNQRIEMFSNQGGEGKDGAVITAPLKGSSNAFVSITVRYSITPDKVIDIYNLHKNQSNLKDNVLKPGIRDEVRVATSAFQPFEVKERRAELTENIRERLTERWESIGVTIDDIDLGDLSLDEKTEEALRLVNQRQAQVEEARAALNKARIDAEKVKTDAQAQADADQIIRCGATTTTVTQDVAGKQEEVTVIAPKEGAACENRINEQVILRNLVEVYEKLAGTGQLVIKDGDSLLQLPPVGSQQQQQPPK